LGSIITPMIADRIGRRWTMLVMSILFILAIIIEVTSKSYWQIVVGRFINYIPMGIAGALVPVYQVRSLYTHNPRPVFADFAKRRSVLQLPVVEHS
jgi:MFS family permease